MSKRIFLILISIILIFSFIPPLTISAQEVNWPLKQNKVENLLDIIRKEPLAEANFDLFFESIEGYEPNSPRKTGAVVLVKQVILKEQFDYWFKQVPKELSIKFIKTAFKVIPLIYSQDISGVINFIEKLSVQKATDYAIEWLLQNEIKIGSGELSYSFYSYKGNWQEIKIQYIIVYHSLGQNRGEIVTEFYSKNPIEPPENRGSVGYFGGDFDWISSTCWPYSYWLENERKRNNDGKLEPFILRAKGYVKKDRWGRFGWDDNKDKPSVEIDFDNPVPEIENSDFILENPPSKISFAGEVMKLFWEKLKSKTSDITTNFLDTIKDYFSKSRPEAQIAEQIKEEKISPLSEPTSELTLEPTEEEISEVEEILREILEQGISEETIPTLEELNERFNKISDEVDALISRIRELLALAQVEEELEEEPEEEPEEEIVICSLSDARYPAMNKVIFNEIAWMGTKNSSNDEWIELRNITGEEIDLNGWQILDKATIEGETRGIKIIFENVTISPGGLFLLERTDDTTVPNISADLIYTGSLNNTNEAIYLFDKDCNLQDKIEANPNWPAGNNNSKRTMERNQTNLGWQTSSNPEGTPKVKNSSGYYESSTETNGSESSSGGTTSSGAQQSSSQPPIFYPVLINEIMYDLDGSDEGREWIEIFNATNTSVDLIGWKLYENETNHNLTLIQGTNVLSPNEYAVIADNNEEFLKDFPEYSGILFKSSFSLNNTGENLAFKNGDLLIDQVSYSSEWGADGDGNSLQKISPNLNSENSNNWKPAPPTPGAINTFPTTDNGESTSTTATSTTATSTTATSTTATSTTATTTSATTTNYSSLDVVINEIAWMGTKADYNDEWMELYNNTNEEINLNDWVINWGEGTTTRSINLTGNISAYDFYLLERTASTTVFDIEEDQIYTGALRNEGEKLELLDSNSNLIDEVDCSNGWFAGNNEAKQTMERINSRVSGDNSENWADNNGKTINGLDAENNLIMGTPKAKNSIFSTSPPNPVPNFSIDKENSKYNTVFLTWSTTTDPDTPEQDISYIIYWAKEEISEENASVTSPTAFSTSTATTTFILFALDYNSTYYFGIRAFDGENYSSLSTTTSYNTPLPPINDLNAGTSAIRKAADLFWTAPGAESYLIKYAEKEIVENPVDEGQITWEDAVSVENLIIPKTYREIESFTVENLIPDKIYYFAIRSINAANATSEISNSSKDKVIPGFIDNGDGTVTDLYTGLMWIKDGGSLGCNNGGILAWQEAKNFSDNLILCNNGTFITTSTISTSTCTKHNGIKYDDWKLPNFKELASIIDYSKNSPAIDENYFINTILEKYWTSSNIYLHPQAYTYSDRYQAYSVDFNNGYIKSHRWGGGYPPNQSQSPSYYVRPVRGPDPGMPNILLPTGIEGDTPGTCNLGYTENDDGTVIDNCTGLVWIKGGTTVLIGSESNYPLSPRPKTISWKNAINLCNDLTTAGYNDWQLPNIREIINVSNKNGSVILPWESGYSGYYWSSTSDGNNAWGTGNGYNAGKVEILSKDGSVYIQCLRSNIGS